MSPWDLIGWCLVGFLGGLALATLVSVAVDILDILCEAIDRLFDFWPLKIFRYIWNWIMRRGWTA